VLLGRNPELVVEGVVPDLLHVVPVGDDAVLDRVLEREDTALGLGLVTGQKERRLSGQRRRPEAERLGESETTHPT
jgi:hypothetical protein